jgi:hypothetical protein
MLKVRYPDYNITSVNSEWNSVPEFQFTVKKEKKLTRPKYVRYSWPTPLHDRA